MTTIVTLFAFMTLALLAKMAVSGYSYEVAGTNTLVMAQRRQEI